MFGQIVALRRARFPRAAAAHRDRHDRLGLHRRDPAEHLIPAWLGPDTGVTGLIIATFAGALTPGGPVVGFAIATAALKSGAGAPQVIAYSIAWALFALPRVLVFEIPMMPPRVVWLRVAVSLPLPFLAAWMAMLVGKP